MDLWIRSQDRCELRKVNGVVMAQEGKFFAIYPVVKELGELEILGNYKSEERALEIINEIEATLKIFSKSREIFVYEMPKE